MKSIFLLSTFLVLSFKCVHRNLQKLNNTKFRAVHVVGNTPVFTADTSFDVGASYDIFYYDNLIMYKFEYRFDSLVNCKLLLQESRPNFFVFHKDSAFGYSYYPPAGSTAIEGRISVDTMLKRNAYEPFKFDTSSYSKPDSIYFDDEKNLVNVYNSQVSEDYPERFTIYLYYSKKLNGLTETLSKNKDRVNGMKLFKIRILAHGHYYEKFEINQPQREYLYEMTEIPVENRTEIVSYFDRYRKSVLRGF